MKNKILLLVLITSFLGYAQNLVPVAVSQNMSKGMQPGIEIYIPNISDDHLEDAIKDITKPYKGKCKKVKRTDETFIDDALISEISANTIDIHQFMRKEGDGYKYTAFFNLGGIFLDSAYSTEKFTYAMSIVKRIALRASELKMNEILKDENKILENLEDDKKDLLKENEREAKDIQKAKDLVAKKESAIQENLKMLETKTSEIETQRQKVIELQNQKAQFIQ
ncbi:hypothetical protein [Flavobacterium sp. UMI-01]|uniref:hypothetical protein n=1 Tax=Flavobacterium sp. UMI-01 TaxID=1441053 RepID=UPI001C7CCE2E|nr:hypothetical protein [Flavobacterium sp. UMI-01]GIZ07970.1 hypothetical protein FUMI01_06970 [Flavobacterium sp. UMI-01]